MGSPTLDQLSAALEIAAEQSGKRILVIDSSQDSEALHEAVDCRIVIVDSPLDIVDYAVRHGLIDRLEPLLLEIPRMTVSKVIIKDMEAVAMKVAVEGDRRREERPFHFSTKAERRRALRGNKRK